MECGNAGDLGCFGTSVELCWLAGVGRVVALGELGAHKQRKKVGESVRFGVVEPAGRSA